MFKKKSAKFSIFKTVKLGTLPNAQAIPSAIAKAGGRVSNWAADLMNRMTVAKKETKVELVVASVAELGFKEGATYADICEKAKQLGLGLCPAEVGPQLRLQYTNQPNGEWLTIAMKPITGSDGSLSVFLVVRGDSGLWLSSDDGHPDDFWYGYSRFVFVRRK